MSPRSAYLQAGLLTQVGGNVNTLLKHYLNAIKMAF